MPNVADKPRYVLLCIQNNSSIKQKTTTFREEKKQFLPGQWHSDKIAQTFFLLAMVLKADLELIIL